MFIVKYESSTQISDSDFEYEIYDSEEQADISIEKRKKVVEQENERRIGNAWSIWMSVEKHTLGSFLEQDVTDLKGLKLSQLIQIIDGIE